MGRKRSFIRRVVKPTRKFVREWGLSAAAVGVASVLAYNNYSLRNQNQELANNSNFYELRFAKLGKRYKEAKRINSEYEKGLRTYERGIKKLAEEYREARDGDPSATAKLVRSLELLK